MVKALAFEVAGPDSVAGATKAVLESSGCLEFRFPNERKAEDFRVAVARYLPGVLATVERGPHSLT
jgi:hypothetical protein